MRLSVHNGQQRRCVKMPRNYVGVGHRLGEVLWFAIVALAWICKQEILMSTTTTVEILCDTECGAYHCGESCTEESAREDAMRYGWSSNEEDGVTKDYCPDCSKENK